MAVFFMVCSPFCFSLPGRSGGAVLFPGGGRCDVITLFTVYTSNIHETRKGYSAKMIFFASSAAANGGG